jgi:hypothetical protein
VGDDLAVTEDLEQREVFLAKGRYTLRLLVTQGDRRKVRDAGFQVID